jgi:hypothetical protein
MTWLFKPGTFVPPLPAPGNASALCVKIKTTGTAAVSLEQSDIRS